MRAYAPDNSVSIDFTLRLVMCGITPFSKNYSHPIFQSANVQIEAHRRQDYLNSSSTWYEIDLKDAFYYSTTS